MGKIEKLPVSALTRDLNLQPRERIDDTTVASYAADIAAGAKMPAVVVFDDGTKRYWLADGFHRCEAALKALGEGAEVEVDLRKGDGDAAFLFSLGANAEHGLRRTNKDIKRAVERCLARFSGYTDRQVAKVCKVDHKTVKAHRPDPVGEVPQQTRTGADGKQYKAKKQKTPPAPAEPPKPPAKAPPLNYKPDRGAGGADDEAQPAPDYDGPVTNIDPPAPQDKPAETGAQTMDRIKGEFREDDDGKPAPEPPPWEADFSVMAESPRASATIQKLIEGWPKQYWPTLAGILRNAAERIER